MRTRRLITFKNKLKRGSEVKCKRHTDVKSINGKEYPELPLNDHNPTKESSGSFANVLVTTNPSLDEEKSTSIGNNSNLTKHDNPQYNHPATTSALPASGLSPLAMDLYSTICKKYSRTTAAKPIFEKLFTTIICKQGYLNEQIIEIYIIAFIQEYYGWKSEEKSNRRKMINKARKEISGFIRESKSFGNAEYYESDQEAGVCNLYSIVD